MYEDLLEIDEGKLGNPEGLHFNAKHYLTIHSHGAGLKNPTILEQGVQSGKSTKLFMSALHQGDQGVLVSVDIDDCSNEAASPKWQFIRSDSADVKKIIDDAPVLGEGIDMLIIDSLHTTEHVKKKLHELVTRHRRFSFGLQICRSVNRSDKRGSSA